MALILFNFGKVLEHIEKEVSNYHLNLEQLHVVVKDINHVDIDLNIEASKVNGGIIIVRAIGDLPDAECDDDRLQNQEKLCVKYNETTGKLEVRITFLNQNFEEF